MCDKPFAREGRVISMRHLAGSFMQAKVLAGGETVEHTVGLGEGGCLPKVGDRIKVVGVIRNGRHLTEKGENA